MNNFKLSPGKSGTYLLIWSYEFDLEYGVLFKFSMQILEYTHS